MDYVTGVRRPDGSENVEYRTEFRHELTTAGDPVLVRQATTSLASDIGFDEQATEEIGIVASELAENVHEHAEQGELVVATITDGDRDGIRLESLDAGPGIDDVEAAFADGESTVGSLGRGLGAVNRLMDRVTVSVPGEPEYGTQVVADRWVTPAYEQSRESPLDIGAASRPMTPSEPNGDSFVIKRWNDKALVGVIDGLGHGLPAHRASNAARAYVERHFDQPLPAIFEGAGRACRGTRGVVMALARFDWADGTVEFAGIGNIYTHLDGPERGSLAVRRGVVGGNAPEPYVETLTWKPSYRLALHSDGVSSRWNWVDCKAVADSSATEQARWLLGQFDKDDDATVLVVSPA